MATAPPAREPLFRHPWRVAVVAVALIAVLNLGVILVINADTSEPGTESLPEVVESISPQAGELTGLVDDVSVDLRDDLTGELVIDGREIPLDQTDGVPELGILTFRPGPDKELNRFRPGENTVLVRYWQRGAERPDDPPTYGWRFRAAA
jgi:hypothetical protein